MNKGAIKMTEDEIKERAILVVKTLEEEKSLVLPHYLESCIINKKLAKYLVESPIDGIDPINWSIDREIKRINPGVSWQDRREIKSAVFGYLIENNYADKYFEYKKP